MIGLPGKETAYTSICCTREEGVKAFATMTEPTPSTQLIARLFRGYLRPYLSSFALAIFFMAMAGLMAAAQTFILSVIIDEIFQSKNYDHVVSIAIMTFAVFSWRGFSTYWQVLIMNRIGQRIVTNIQQALYQHIMKLDLAFFHANASGVLMSRLTNDVVAMRYAMSECLTSSFRGTFTLIGLVFSMFYQDWRLASFAFVVFPPTAWYVAKMGKKMRRIASHAQAEQGLFTAFLSQTFQGIRHVKAYGMEIHEQARVQAITENIFRLSLKGFRASSVTQPVTDALSGLVISAVMLYGGKQIITGGTTPGTLVAFIAAFMLAYEPMKRMAKMNGQLQSGLAAAERVFRVLDTQPLIGDVPNVPPLLTSNFTIGLDHVQFAYPDGTQAVQEISLLAPHGKTTAIVGASGSGKSTIVNLILRFYDVQQGAVTIGGKNIKEMQLASLRGHIALVSQETALFDESIRANIAYGKAGATDAEIEAAAVDAFADGFIRALPQGFETVVGEMGVKLSGGQRQRIAIARAMLRNAPILLLDEATSALDNESERAVQEALRRLQRGRTTIVIAHRLSTIVDADQIVVLDHGRVIEQGTHRDLLQRNGAYARLYGSQIGFDGDENMRQKLPDCAAAQ